MDLQEGDNPIPFFSYQTDPKFHVEQIPCYLTYTTEETKAVIRANLHRSPMYSGEIVGTAGCEQPAREMDQLFTDASGI